MLLARQPIEKIDFDAEAVFATRGWLADTSNSLRKKIIEAGRRMTVVAGERLISPGDLPGGIYGVLTGGIAIEGATQWHAPRVGHVYRAGHWFGHGPALHGGVRTMGYFAMEDSCLFTVPLQSLRNLMRDDPDVIALVGQMATRGTDLAGWITCDLLIPAAPQRIAAVLLRITGAHEKIESSDPNGFRLTQNDIGEMANVSRIYVSRVLSHFEKLGWISKGYGHIRLIDFEKLKEFAYLSHE